MKQSSNLFWGFEVGIKMKMIRLQNQVTIAAPMKTNRENLEGQDVWKHMLVRRNIINSTTVVKERYRNWKRLQMNETKLGCISNLIKDDEQRWIQDSTNASVDITEKNCFKCLVLYLSCTTVYNAYHDFSGY
jgi:hypothetical protein